MKGISDFTKLSFNLTYVWFLIAYQPNSILTYKIIVLSNLPSGNLYANRTDTSHIF